MKFKKIFTFFLTMVSFCLFNNDLFGNIDDKNKEETNGIKIYTEKYPYYDALELSKVSDEQDKRIIEILNKYLKEPASTLTELKQKLTNENNRFLIKFFEGLENVATFIPEDVEPVQAPKVAPVGLSVTKLAEGMAKFLVERVKEELSTAFFKRFQKDIIDNPEYEILHVLFPQTKNMLKKIDKEIYKFSSYIQVLREAFEKDLSNIYSNFRQLLDEEVFRELFQNNEKVNVLIEIVKLALSITDELSMKVHPADILEGLDLDDLEIAAGDDNMLITNLCSSIKLLRFFSRSLKSIPESNNDKGRYWVDFKSLKKLIDKGEENNKYKTFKIYLGLLYQDAKDIEFHFKSGTKKFGVILNKICDEIDPENSKNTSQGNQTELKKSSLDNLMKLISVVRSFGSKVDFINNHVIELSKKKDEGKKIDYNDYYKFYNATLDLVEYTHDIYGILKDQISNDSGSTLDSEIKKYVNVARALGNIYLDINHRNYSSVVFNAVSVFDEILPGKKEIRAKILKYGSFMAAVTKAENSDQVKEAIKSVALPAGSYSIKRNSSYNISLNAYVGMAYSSELSKGEKKISNSLYVWAPIGVAFSIGNWCIGSVSIFLSIIDLGAVTAYRFKSEEEQEEQYIPDFTLKNIIAPGLHLVLGIKKLPISIGGGIQYGPQIRKIVETENNLIKPNALRFSVFIAVDIPLLNFYTKTKY